MLVGTIPAGLNRWFRFVAVPVYTLPLVFFITYTGRIASHLPFSDGRVNLTQWSQVHWNPNSSSCGYSQTMLLLGKKKVH